MAESQYYGYVVYNRMGTDSGTIKSVSRIFKDRGKVLHQCYDFRIGKWIPNPGLIAVTGVGGDSSFEEITRSQAVAWVKKQNPPEGAEPV